MSWDATTPSFTTLLETSDSNLPTATPFTIVYWIRHQVEGDLDSHYTLGTTSPEETWGSRVRSTAPDYQLWGWDGSGGPGTGVRMATGGIVDTWVVKGDGWGQAADTPDRWTAVDGESTSNHTDSSSHQPTPTGPTLWLGQDSTSSGREFDGYMAGVIIYNRLLTNAEWQSHYVSAEKGVYPFHVAEDAILYCWMLDGDGSKALRYGVDLTETGSPSFDTAQNPTFINRITRSNFAGF